MFPDSDNTLGNGKFWTSPSTFGKTVKQNSHNFVKKNKKNRKNHSSIHFFLHWLLNKGFCDDCSVRISQKCRTTASKLTDNWNSLHLFQWLISYRSMIMPFHVTISILVQTQLSLTRKSQNEKSANVKMIIIFDRSQTSHFISA